MRARTAPDGSLTLGAGLFDDIQIHWTWSNGALQYSTTWAPSNPAVATITSEVGAAFTNAPEARVIAVSPGTTTITATVTSVELDATTSLPYSHSATIDVTVPPPAPQIASLAVSPGSLSLVIGGPVVRLAV